MAGKKGMRHYAVALKEQAVRLALEEAKTATEIAAQLQLREPSRVAVWVRAYRREGVAGLCKPQSRPRQRPHSDLARLQMENASVKKMAFRIARHYTREAQYRAIEHYRTALR